MFTVELVVLNVDDGGVVNVDDGGTVVLVWVEAGVCCG